MNTIFEGKHVLVIERDGWEFVERKNGKEAVAVIALTDDDELILVEQYRRPVDARVIDLPAGLVGDDGPTHHGLFDISYLRCLPNMVLMAPRDEAMLVHMLHTAVR